MSLPLVFKVASITQDAPNLKTYGFKHNLRAKPGQFLMIWMPGVDEVPMSIGWQTDTEFHVGIAKAGDCTTAIFDQIKVGEKMGIRGPYGTSFRYKEYDHLIGVGGGYGTPPLLNLAQRGIELGKKVTMIQGARSRDYLLYESYFNLLKVDLQLSTDDGTSGYKGYCTDLLEEALRKMPEEEKKKTCIYTCGPELMMVKVAELCRDHGVDSQVSLERYMKCGFGICGQCCMDDSGIRLCKDGPVITGEQALGHPEFGNYSRTQSGLLKK